jgi:Protein of unknown function (DUF3604)
MFTVETFDGAPLTAELAAQRIRFEPLIEATQIKGDGESHPFLSPSDEFAGYEIWARSNLNGTELKTPEMLKYEYAREALKTGLRLESELGVNPYKFGMVGSTDSHTSLSTSEEGELLRQALRRRARAAPLGARGDRGPRSRPQRPWLAAGGQRPRRGLGGREHPRGDLRRHAAQGDLRHHRHPDDRALPRRLGLHAPGRHLPAAGGGRLPEGRAHGRRPSRRAGGKSPTFLVAALKDAYSGNLDRIQIVKGWLDAEGNTQEQVYDVAWSDDRPPGADGRLPPVGNTVDVARATWTNTIGDPELIAVWTDPDFDPALSAFYYAKVIEIPTPRWTAYEALRFGVDMPDEVPMTTQERAYTSPIWYIPADRLERHHAHPSDPGVARSHCRGRPGAGHRRARRPDRRAERPALFADNAFPGNVYFGDTHVHTGLSADAGGSGTTLMPATPTASPAASRSSPTPASR